MQFFCDAIKLSLWPTANENLDELFQFTTSHNAHSHKHELFKCRTTACIICSLFQWAYIRIAWLILSVKVNSNALHLFQPLSVLAFDVLISQIFLGTIVNWVYYFRYFLPHCMQCRRGLAIKIMSVCLSVCLSNACIVTKRKKDLSRFLYHTKEHLA